LLQSSRNRWRDDGAPVGRGPLLRSPVARIGGASQRRVMTRRGRVTVGGLLALGFLLGFQVARRVSDALADERVPPAPAAGVAAGPPAAAPPGAPTGPGIPAAAASAFTAPAADSSPSSASGPPHPVALHSAGEPLPVPPAPPPVPDAVLALLPPTAREGLAAADVAKTPGQPVEERVPMPAPVPGILGPLEVQYTVDAELSRAVADILRRHHVRLGHVILLDPTDGRVLAYVSTDPQDFPPTRPYPMASLMKVVTAAAVLKDAPDAVGQPCVFRGSPYYLSAQLLDPPRVGHVATFERALATSNNQCFAQLAVHQLGAMRVLDELSRLGVLEAPAPGHPPGEVDPVETRLDLGELGSGLAGTRLPPLAAARLAAALAHGQLVSPHWIARVTDANGVDLALPQSLPRQALSPGVTRELRGMLIETTLTGTARRGFHGPRGRFLLAPIHVAGKTGSLSGSDPAGRYEWFIGVAPAEDPRVAVATLIVNQGRRWASATRVSAEVLREVFCADGPCRAPADELDDDTGPADGGSDD
jgi:peptidoglycan glycosyltransferase